MYHKAEMSFPAYQPSVITGFINYNIICDILSFYHSLTYTVNRNLEAQPFFVILNAENTQFYLKWRK